MGLDLIHGRDVAQLNNHEFRRVLNSLLTVEVNQNHVPLDQVVLTTNDNEADAGIDGRVIWPKDIRHDLLKPGENVVQYKSGTLTKSELEKEFKKKGVQAALRRGAYYLMCVAKDYNPTTIEKRQAELRALCKSKRIASSHARIVFGEMLARWISKYPAVVILPEFRKNIPGFVTVERWQKENPQLSTPFLADSARLEMMHAIREFLDSNRPESALRVEGPAGVGKTRLVLEAVLDSRYAGRTVYALNADSQKVQEFLSAIYSDPETFALVVADECDSPRQSVLAQYAENSSGRLKLVCIGISEVLYDAAPLTLTPVYQLRPLADQDIEIILEDSFPGVPKEFIEASVRLASGYVKLAMFIMQVLERHGNQPPIRLVEVRDIRVFLQKFVEPTTRKSLQVLSLLARIGWEEDLRAEAQTVADFVGLPFVELQEATRKLRDLGVVVARGRYLYVSPDLLAVKAAADLWDERGHQLIELVQKFPDRDPRRQLLRRIAMMGEHKEVRTAVERILSRKGVFPSLEELNDSLLSEIFRILSAATPVRAVDLLMELILSAVESELLNLKEGRRDVIWALESLLRWPETSLKAARVLSKLAVFETETFANNATGVLGTYFHVFLSGSPLPLIERFVLIDELLHSGYPQSRQLAVRLASASLVSFESRSGGEIDPMSKRPFPREWKPQTYGEIWDVRRKALSILQQIAEGEDEAAALARQARLKAVGALIHQGQFDDAIEVVEKATAGTDAERRTKMNACEILLASPTLSEEQRGRVRRARDDVFGATYFERLRRWIGRRLNSDFDDRGSSGFEEADKKVFQLAEEAFDRGIQDRELEWLASPEAENVWLFGKRLGQLDTSGRFWERIALAAPDDINCMLLAAYLDGGTHFDVDGRRDDWLDSLSDTKPYAAFGGTWRAEPTIEGSKRIIRLVTEGLVSPSTLRVLRYGGWVERLPIEATKQLIDLMLTKSPESNVEAVMGVLDHAIRSETVSAGMFGEAIWTALQLRPQFTSPSYDWHWGRLAELVAASNPARLAKVFVALFESDDTWLQTESGNRVGHCHQG